MHTGRTLGAASDARPAGRTPSMSNANGAIARLGTSSLTLDAAQVTEAAAIASVQVWSGRATKRRRTRRRWTPCAPRLNALPMDGRDRDRRGRAGRGAHAVHRREGGDRTRAPSVDIALDPLEGTTLTAKAMANALAVVAFAAWRRHAACARHLHGEDRGAVRAMPEGVIDLDATPGGKRSGRLAAAKGCATSRDHRLRARSPAPRRDHRQPALGGRASVAI